MNVWEIIQVVGWTITIVAMTAASVIIWRGVWELRKERKKSA
jgi:hypothetical protein